MHSVTPADDTAAVPDPLPTRTAVASSSLRDLSGPALQSLHATENLGLRQRTEQAPTDDRRRLARITDIMQIGTWEWDLTTSTVQVNEHWLRLTGSSNRDLGPHRIEALLACYHPDDQQHVQQLVTQLLDNPQQSIEVEACVGGPDGCWLWVCSRGWLVRRTASGAPAELYFSHQNITERKRQDEALHKSQAFLDRTSRLAGVGVWEVDLLAREVRWCNETRRLYGVEPWYTPTLDHYVLFCAPEARPVMLAAVQTALQGGPGFDLELPFIRADGQRLWIRSVGSVEFVDDTPVRLIGSYQDVSERVQERSALAAANERALLATNSGGIGIWDWDLLNNQLSWDAWMYRLYGLPADTEYCDPALWVRHIYPDDLLVTQKAIQAALDGGSLSDIEFRVVWPDGSLHYLHGSGLVKHDEHGRAVRMVGTNWDITHSRKLAADLSEQHEMLRVTLKSIGDAVITTDAKGNIAWLNPVAEHLTGWQSGDAFGRPLAQVFHIVHQQTRALAENPVALCLKQGNTTSLANQTLLVSRDGKEFGIEDSAAPIRNEYGEVLGAVLVFHDVTEQRRLSGEMSYRASHDALTGLVNRAEFETRLARALRRAHEDNSEHALLYIDLDQFKLVNDACGHSVGDQLLQQVSKLLSACVRDHDTLARLGGDEFGIILEHCTAAQAQHVAQQICDGMEQFRFLHDGRRFRIGTSIGLVPVDRRWSTPLALQQAADTSCYAAKEAGRNRVHAWFDSDMAMHARHGEMQWTLRIEQALDEDRFVLYAQRIHPLHQQPHGLHAEVLLRMLDVDGSLIQPGAFLPAAERFHLASRIDRWVVKRSIAWMQALPSLDLVENLSINLSGQSVGDRAFHRWMLEVLSAAGGAISSRLCFEVTETSAVTNLADAALFIEQIRAVGVRVALDDFGAGASSFGYLKTMPVDYLKIDGQFVRNVVDDPLDDAAVRCFVDVARVVNVKTVAEFVDKPSVLEHLRQIGVDYVQGFLLHRPAPIEELLGR